MLDNFKDSQKYAYELLIKSIKKNRVSHAYLIDGNNNKFAFDFVMSFVKMLVCKYNFTNDSKCSDCNICKRIDDNNYSEVKIIESDSLVIKKGQLLELQNEFSKSAIEGNKRVYVIKECDKMNKHASNSLLKFLEEPSANIIAILFTNDVNKVLSTIRSRCQFIRLKRDIDFKKNNAIDNFASICCNNSLDLKNFSSDESKIGMINSIISFLIYFEENGLDVIIFLKKMWYNNFSERKDCIFALTLMIYFYYDIFKYYYGLDDYFFNDYFEDIVKISNFNNNKIVIKKINICIDVLDSLKINSNINLVIDNMLIRLEECKNEYS